MRLAWICGSTQVLRYYMGMNSSINILVENIGESDGGMAVYEDWLCVEVTVKDK